MRPAPDHLTPLECWPVHNTRQDKSVRFSCTCSLRDFFGATAAHSFSDEVRSPNAFTANTTTLLSTVQVVIELYLLAALARWTITRLSASSCEQGASPSMSLGCRKTTSLSIVQMTLSVDTVTIYLPTQCQLVTIYLPTQCQLCVQLMLHIW